jgi:hypothetical protein
MVRHSYCSWVNGLVTNRSSGNGQKAVRTGAPGGIRTPGLCLRRAALYPDGRCRSLNEDRKFSTAFRNLRLLLSYGQSNLRMGNLPRSDRQVWHQCG